MHLRYTEGTPEVHLRYTEGTPEVHSQRYAGVHWRNEVFARVHRCTCTGRTQMYTSVYRCTPVPTVHTTCTCRCKPLLYTGCIGIQVRYTGYVYIRLHICRVSVRVDHKVCTCARLSLEVYFHFHIICILFACACRPSLRLNIWMLRRNSTLSSMAQMDLWQRRSWTRQAHGSTSLHRL